MLWEIIKLIFQNNFYIVAGNFTVRVDCEDMKKNMKDIHMCCMWQAGILPERTWIGYSIYTEFEVNLELIAKVLKPGFSETSMYVGLPTKSPELLQLH